MYLIHVKGIKNKIIIIIKKNKKKKIRHEQNNKIRPSPPSKNKTIKKMNKKEQPVRFEPKKCSLWFSNPPRYHLSYLDFIDHLCIYPVMKGKSHNFVNKT